MTETAAITATFDRKAIWDSVDRSVSNLFEARQRFTALDFMVEQALSDLDKSDLSVAISVALEQLGEFIHRANLYAEEAAGALSEPAAMPTGRPLSELFPTI